MTGLIQTFFSSLGNLDRAKELVSEDVVFIAVRAERYSELPLYGTTVGYAGLEVFVSNLRAAFDTQSFLVDHVIESETKGAAFGRFEHRIRATGRLFRSHWAVFCEFADGKITTYRFYEDTAALEEAMERRTECRERMT
jgi:uncharacterized protein